MSDVREDPGFLAFWERAEQAVQDSKPEAPYTPQREDTMRHASSRAWVYANLFLDFME